MPSHPKHSLKCHRFPSMLSAPRTRRSTRCPTCAASPGSRCSRAPSPSLLVMMRWEQSKMKFSCFKVFSSGSLSDGFYSQVLSVMVPLADGESEEEELLPSRRASLRFEIRSFLGGLLLFYLFSVKFNPNFLFSC